MQSAIVKQDDGQMLEGVLLQGDLSRLAPAQRVSYYRRVCDSLGLNPFTKPFDYIQLNGKLTLYAKKDAADQLRKIHGVSIDDVEITETETQFIVKVKGHDSSGRSDVEVGVVNKQDMRGDTANAQMKAVTKSKRRLTLSICGLGWLDETEVQTIPDATPVTITESGEVVSGRVEQEAPKSERPYPAEVVKAKIEEHAAAIKQELVSGKRKFIPSTRQVLAAQLSNIFPDDTQRYEVSAWLADTASTKTMSPEYVMALLGWLGAKNFDDPIVPAASQEAQACHAAALKAQGQMEMPA